jgi:hypothetical protein
LACQTNDVLRLDTGCRLYCFGKDKNIFYNFS